MANNRAAAVSSSLVVTPGRTCPASASNVIRATSATRLSPSQSARDSIDIVTSSIHTAPIDVRRSLVL
jgi:hypothetical protein